MIQFQLTIKKSDGTIKEFNSWMEVSWELWEGTGQGGYRSGDAIYAHSRIDALFGLLGISLLLNDLERCSFRPILRLLKAESAFIELGSTRPVGMLYEDLRGAVHAPPDAVSEGDDTIELKDKWEKGEI